MCTTLIGCTFNKDVDTTGVDVLLIEFRLHCVNCVLADAVGVVAGVNGVCVG